MDTTPTHLDEADLDTAFPHRLRNRLIVILTAVLVILILAFIPPLINVSRFQRRVDRDISASLGRPVHFDRLSLTMLPLPGFTLENFVIDEDPAFGFEPILRADQVRATIRISSLWRRHVEISKISLSEPTSVNLVHLANGKWNIESLLLQASHIEAAPTAQRFAGPAPRFPYIEATGARLNLKLDQDKSRFSLTDADFALWLPEPHQWHLRLEAHPTRTDLSPGDTGTFRIEGILGRTATPAPQPTSQPASSLAQIPIDFHGDWRSAQLGDLSRLISSSDAGLRGDFSLTFALVGTLDHNTITTDIKLANARRADFVPSHPLALEAGCRAIASNTFHSFTSIECHWPPAEAADTSMLIVTADLPDVRQPLASSVHITLPALPAATLVDWLSVATPHPPIGLAGSGTLAGTVAWGPTPKSSDRQPTSPRKPSPQQALPQQALPQPSWSGELEFSSGSLDIDSVNHKPIALDDIILRSTPPAAATSRTRRQAAANLSSAPDSFDLLPISLPLGGTDPATLQGHLDDSGYTLHLSGSVIPARLLALGDAIPQLGDGLKDCLPHAPVPPSAAAPASPRGGVRGSAVLPGEVPVAPVVDQPIRIDLTATRPWGGPQTWCRNPAPRIAAPSGK